MIGLVTALALRNLPGALPSETALAQRWLREHGDIYRGFDFNVGVGHGADVPANIGEQWASFARERSQRKIDIVCYTDVGIDLMEVKGKADPCAIGQIRVYSRLWNREHPTERVGTAGVICALCDDDIRFALMFEAVHLYEYPDLVGVIRRT